MGDTSIAASKQLYPTQETLRQRLQNQKANYQERLADVEKALALLDANPLLEDFHNAIQKTGY